MARMADILERRWNRSAPYSKGLYEKKHTVNGLGQWVGVGMVEGASALPLSTKGFVASGGT